MFYCTTTRKTMCDELGLHPKHLKWLLNAPTHIVNDDTIRIWEYVLKQVHTRLGELVAVREVVNHKMTHIRKARVEQSMRKNVDGRL